MRYATLHAVLLLLVASGTWVRAFAVIRKDLCHPKHDQASVSSHGRTMRWPDPAKHHGIPDFSPSEGSGSLGKADGQTVSGMVKSCEHTPSSPWHLWLFRPLRAPLLVPPHPPSPSSLWRRFSAVTLSPTGSHIHRRSESWTAVQIATPITVGLAVAAFSVLIFVYYRRRHRSPPSSGPMPHHARTPVTYSGLIRARLNAPTFFFGLLPGTARSRDRMREPDWEIDDGEAGERLRGHGQQPSSSSLSTFPRSVSTTTPTPFTPQIEEEEEEEEEDHGYFPVPTDGHSRTGSKTYLARSPSPQRKQPRSLWDRIVKYTDGLRKSPSYRSGRVRPLRRNHSGSLGLDGAPAVQLLSPPPNGTIHSESRTGSAVSDTTNVLPSTLPCAPAKTHVADAHESSRSLEPDERSVLLISRVPGEDFTLEDTTTVFSERRH